jgi:hypothetical protein
VSSVGPGYRSVWHRTPGGEWTIYANAAPEFSCARYFGSAVHHTVETDVDIEWSGPFTALITVPGVMDWRLQLGTSAATSMLTAMAMRMPERLWRNEFVLRAMGAFAGPLLNAGTSGFRNVSSGCRFPSTARAQQRHVPGISSRMKVSGVVPNGQTFQAQPRQLWLVTDSQATILGKDAGVPGGAGGAGPSGGLLASATWTVRSPSGRQVPVHCPARRAGARPGARREEHGRVTAAAQFLLPAVMAS